MELERGWLERVFQDAARERENWPEWMKQVRQMDPPAGQSTGSKSLENQQIAGPVASTATNR